MIQEVERNYLPKNLKELYLQENPILSLNINCQEISGLKQITFGSRSTHYISTPLLKRLLETEMKIILPDQFKEYLHLPQANVINDQSALARYLRSPEKYLSSLSGIELKVAALEWLMFSSQSTFTEISGSESFTRWLVSLPVSLPVSPPVSLPVSPLSRSLSRPLSYSLSCPLSHIGWWFGLQVVGTPHHYRW